MKTSPKSSARLLGIAPLDQFDGASATNYDPQSNRRATNFLNERWHLKHASGKSKHLLLLRTRNGSNKPPNNGPIIPAMLSCKLPKVAAEGNSASEMTWRTIDVQAGALIANPTPMKNAVRN